MKAHSLEKSLQDAKSLLKCGPCMIITMNGLGLEDVVAMHVANEKLIECIVLFPSRLENNKVINTGGNATIMAEKNNISEEIIPVLFDREKIDFSLIENFKQQQWQKAVANIGMNAVSAIILKTVGEVLDTPPLVKVITKLIKETVEIARKKEGISLLTM